MRQLKPATSTEVAYVQTALEKLREARDLLRAAGADNALKRTRAALTSAEGALRHVYRRAGR